MPIQIDWLDSNGNSPIKVYRSETPIPESPLPTPIGTVPVGTSRFTDKTAVRNKLYFYRIGRTDPDLDDEVLSPNKALAYMPYTGPGPQAILRGDWELGYFGRMTPGELFGKEELYAFSGNLGSLANNHQGWGKFVYQGEILFAPIGGISGGVSFKSLYEAGLIYGDIPEASWPDYVKKTLGVIKQGRQINLREHLFTFRLPSSRANPLSTATTLDKAGLLGGEIDQFLALVYMNRTYPDPNGRFQFDDLPSVSGSPVSMVTRDWHSGTNIILRGNNTGYDAAPLAQAVTTASSGWSPLLSLVL